MVDEKLFDLSKMDLGNNQINILRAQRLIRSAIDKFNLDLSGLVVLTEAATGNYTLTPLIAALGGADRVYAMTRNSRFGNVETVMKQTMELASIYGVSDRIVIFTSREDQRISKADIVTNLGFVRPINKGMIEYLKSTAVIPLMWEPWEYRAEDLDLEECRRCGIAVLGTNERHPDLQTMRYIGYVAIKLLMQNDIEIMNSHISIIGSGEFVVQIADVLHAIGAHVQAIEVDEEGRFDTERARLLLPFCDALVIAEHHRRNILIGPHSQLSWREIYEINQALIIAHICGGIDVEELKQSGIQHTPDYIASPGYMSITTDYVGPKPLIDLHTAGLKIGAMLASCRKRGSSALDSEYAVLKKTDLAKGFDNYHTMSRRDERE